MAVTLLAVFFALVLVRPRLAFIALAVAIVLFYRGRTSGVTRTGPRHVSDDSSI
jgi:membrane-associated PAP2 superfamily phosphatase